MRRLLLILLCLTLPMAKALAQAGVFVGGLPPSRLCRPALDMAERRHGIPARLLHAIGRVESGRADAATGQVNPWPWTANAEGQGFYFDTKAQAVAAITAMRAKGVRSIDVGCMQVNLVHHPDAFANLEQAFDPMANADYAARFLRKLFDQTGDWTKAAAWYHSATPELGAAYQKRVMAVWPEEQKAPGAPGGSSLAAAWGATMPRGLGGQTAPHARIVPAPGAIGSAAQGGRTLDAYRAAPVTWVFRPPPVVRPTGSSSAGPSSAGPSSSSPAARGFFGRAPGLPAGDADTPRPSVHFLR